MNSMKAKQGGFSLLEVMITLVVSNIALLGLAAGQVKALQYSNNSFDYTVSLIQANNVVNRMWNDICKLQQGTQVFNETYASTTLAPITGYTLDFEGINTSPVGPFVNDFKVKVSWVDERMNNPGDNEVGINASFKQFSASCTVI